MKEPKKTKKEIAEVLGIKCAGLLVIIKIGEDEGIAWSELFISCNEIFVAYSMSLFEDIVKAEIAVGEAWDAFWKLFWEGKYKEINKFVGFVNTIILRIFNTIIVDIDKNKIIAVEIEVAMENPKNDVYFMEIPDEIAIKKQERLDSIDEVVKTLSEKDQTIFRMVYKDELKYPYIAKTLGITEGYLRKAISRILEKINLKIVKK